MRWLILISNNTSGNKAFIGGFSYANPDVKHGEHIFYGFNEDVVVDGNPIADISNGHVFGSGAKGQTNWMGVD